MIRLLLEAYYEPSFSDRSHGFRKGRGCHTALREVRDAWTGTAWFIEGDISDCYGSVDHQILLSILAEKIDDQRFLRLVRNMLKAGYLEDWVRHDTLSGVPQGGLCSAEHKPPTGYPLNRSNAGQRCARVSRETGLFQSVTSANVGRSGWALLSNG